VFFVFYFKVNLQVVAEIRPEGQKRLQLRIKRQRRRELHK